MHILIVEDDDRMAALLKRGLEQEGHVAEVSGDGWEGFELASAREFDVMLVDVMIPGVNGFQLARRLRERGCRIPIVMLTAKDGSRDIVSGLDAGADDYVTKPFSFEELLARIRAAARRAPIARPTLLETSDLTLDPARHEVRRGGRIVDLTPKEFQILELLLRRPGRVLSRETILESVWGPGADVEPNTVDVLVGTLRRKIDSGGNRSLIRTIRGVGFCLTEENG